MTPIEIEDVKQQTALLADVEALRSQIESIARGAKDAAKKYRLCVGALVAINPNWQPQLEKRLSEAVVAAVSGVTFSAEEKALIQSIVTQIIGA